MGCADFFVRRKKTKKKKGNRPEHIPHPARLSSFSSFFQLILWQKALVALYFRNTKERVRISSTNGGFQCAKQLTGMTGMLWKADILHCRPKAMFNAPSKSPYVRGKRLLAGSIICGIGVIWGIPISANLVDMNFGEVMWIVGSLMMAWLLYFGISALLLACPRCGRSIFTRGYFLSVPWPAKTCGKCGTDLTERP